MSLRDLPEAPSFPKPQAYAPQLDVSAVERWQPDIVAVDRDPDTTITIFDTIGEDPWSQGGGVTPRRIEGALRSIGDREVTVEINSPGGDFFDGLAIYNLLRTHPQRIRVRVLGMAASAASVIAMAGDEIEMSDVSFFMIHNAWSLAMGNRHDMRDVADTLEQFDGAMGSLYQSRTEESAEQVAQWMDAETWFDGNRSVELGFADRLFASDQVTTDEASASARQGLKAMQIIDTRLATTGMPRSQRRALVAEVKGGTQDAALTVTHDAGAELVKQINALTESLKS